MKTHVRIARDDVWRRVRLTLRCRVAASLGLAVAVWLNMLGVVAAEPTAFDTLAKQYEQDVQPLLKR
ncbi:MAG: hypothetical protein ABGZ17_26400, partial [Planctomycetaceae bacterium]